MSAKNLIGRLFSFFQHEGGQEFTDDPSTTITIGAEANATRIDMRTFAQGSVQPGEAHTTIHVYVSLEPDGSGTYVQGYDSDGAELSLKKVDGSPVGFDPGVYNYPWIKLISNKAGVAVEDDAAKLFKK